MTSSATGIAHGSNHAGRTWSVTGAHRDPWGNESLFWSWDDAPRVVYTASSSATSPASRTVWQAARHQPAILRALADAHAQRDREADEAARQREAEQARIVQVKAEQAALLNLCENEGKRVYLRFGQLPASGRSWNHRDDHSEDGVSVYAAWQLPDDRYVLDLRDVDAISAMFITGSEEAVYCITGKVGTETGSDGEPLIRAPKGRRIHPARIDRII